MRIKIIPPHNSIFNFMCRPDIAIRNMDETGYVSANGAWEVVESQIDEELEPVDLTYFFGPSADSVRVDPVLYPDKAVIERCALEHDWGQDTDKLLAMWARVKGDNATSFTYVILIVAVLALALIAWLGSRSKRNRNRRRRK